MTRRAGPILMRRLGSHRLASRSRGGLTWLFDYTDGSWTLDRASEASYYDPRTGAFADTDIATRAQALIFDAGTNLVGVPGTLTWNNITGTVGIVTGQADPWGGTAAASFTDNDSGVYESAGCNQTFTGPGAASFCAVVKQDVSATHFADVGGGLAGGSGHFAISVHLGTGAVNLRTAGTVTSYGSYIVDGWIYVVAKLSGWTGATREVRFTPAIGNAASFPTIATTGTGTTTLAGVFVAALSETTRVEPGWLVDNEPRVFSDGAVLIEGSRTNQVQQSANLSTWWTGTSATITADADAAPDGSASADRVQATSVQIGPQFDTISLSGSGAWSGFMKNGPTGDGSSNFALSTATSSGGAALDTSLGASYERLRVVGTGRYARTVDGRDFSAIGGDTAGARDVVGWGFQYEDAAAYPSSPIRTSGATATRLGERFQRTIDADLAAMLRSPDGFWFDYWPNYGKADTASASNATLFDVSSAKFRVFHQGATGAAFSLQSSTGVVATTVSASLDFSAGDRLRFHIVAPVVGAWSITVENMETGQTVTASGTPTAIAALEGETLTVGNYATGSFHADGVISRFWLDRGDDPAEAGIPLLDYSTDLTFTRASEAANFDPRTGQFVEATEAANWLGNNTPRIFSDGAILVEGARTNLVAASSPSPATWTNPTKISTHADPAPDGSACPVLTDDNTGGYDTFDAPTITVTATGDHTLAFYVGKKASMGSDGFPQVRLEELTADIGANLSAKLHPTTGALTVTGSATWSTVEDVGDFWLVRVGFSVVTIGDLRLRIYPAIDVTYGGGASVAVTGAIRFWGAQSEAGAYPTSPIRTSGATATRVAEVGSAANSFSTPAFMKTGAWEIDVWPEWSSSSTAVAQILYDGTSRRIRWDGAGSFDIDADGTAGGLVAATFAAGDKITLRVDFPGGVFEVFVNGVSQGTRSIAGGSWSASTSLSFGFAGQVVDAVISQPRAIAF